MKIDFIEKFENYELKLKKKHSTRNTNYYEVRQ